MALFKVVVHPGLPRELKTIARAGRKDVVRRILSSLKVWNETPSGLDLGSISNS